MKPSKFKDDPPPPPLQPNDAKNRVVLIRDLVNDVNQYMKEGKTFDEIKELVPLLANNYPHLFVMITSTEGYDVNTLNLMIQMLDKMGKASMNQHDASIKVGEHLMKNFISKSSVSN